MNTWCSAGSDVLEGCGSPGRLIGRRGSRVASWQLVLETSPTSCFLTLDTGPVTQYSAHCVFLIRVGYNPLNCKLKINPSLGQRKNSTVKSTCCSCTSPGSVPSTHAGWLTTSCCSSSRESNTCPLLASFGTCTHMLRHAHRHTHAHK